MVIHEGVREWQRWKYDMPRRWLSLSQMPFLTSVAFEYLCRKYGKDGDKPNHTDSHAQRVAEDQALINSVSRVS